jgi:hypothetical protein
MIKLNKPLIIFLSSGLMLLSCGSSATFRLSTENATFRGDAEKLKIAIDKIAQENELYPDKNCSCNVPVYLCYMGDPYHYYTIGIRKGPNSTLSLEIMHYVSLGVVDYHKPFDEKLLKMLRTDYKVKQSVDFVTVPEGRGLNSSLQCKDVETSKN